MKRIGWVLGGLAWILTGCMIKTSGPVAVAEEKVVKECVYIDTLSENSDMGAFQIHPKFSSSVREKVLKRAEMLGATHLVWLADYPVGACAMVYYCGN